MGRFAVLIGHFQEEQEGKLLEIVTVADAVVAQGIAEGPDLADDGGGVVGFGGHGCAWFLRYSENFVHVIRIVLCVSGLPRMILIIFPTIRKEKCCSVISG